MQLTPEQEALIPVIKEKWIQRMSTPIQFEKAVAAISAIYKEANLDIPEFRFVDSPYSGVHAIYEHKRQLCEEAGQPMDPDNKAKDLATIAEEALLYEWGQSWCALYELAKELGTKFDEQKYKLYYDYCYDVQTIFPYKEVCYICERPVEIHWDGDILHNDEGPAVLYKDGWKIWALEGHAVDEQIVMFPETQTIEQLNDESNEEIKRIRINRYGWPKYLNDMQAKLLDMQTVNTPLGTSWMEGLYETDRYTVLCTFDPSTGRPYSLEVPPGTKTCKEAQAFLMGKQHFLRDFELEDNGEVYPLIRT